MIDLPILIVRRDGKEDVLTVPTYLVDTEVPFLCGNIRDNIFYRRFKNTNPNDRYTGWSLWNCARNTEKTGRPLHRRFFG